MYVLSPTSTKPKYRLIKMEKKKKKKKNTLRGPLSVFVTLRHTKLTRNYYSLMLCMTQYHCYKAGIKLALVQGVRPFLVKISVLVCVVSHSILLSTKTARYSVIIWPSL